MHDASTLAHATPPGAMDVLRPLGYPLALLAVVGRWFPGLGDITPFLAAVGTCLIGVGSVWAARLKARELDLAAAERRARRDVR